MENKVLNIPKFREYYLQEYQLYDDEVCIIFNIIGIDIAKREIQLVVTDRGKISVITYDLLMDKNARLYFEYGVTFQRVYLDDFEEAG